jgi:hypothetical protein
LKCEIDYLRGRQDAFIKNYQNVEKDIVKEPIIIVPEEPNTILYTAV